MNSDKIEKIKGALIQHGYYNDRIYLLKIFSSENNLKNLLDVLLRLAKKKNIQKFL